MSKSSKNQQGYDPMRGKKRKLSRFLAEELLYDYVANNLDEHRASSVKSFLDSSPETRSELESLKKGMAFCDKLSQTEISPELHYKLSQVRSIFSRTMRVVHWRNWPEVTKWTLEALIISVVVAFVAAVGWPNLVKMLPEPSPELTLARVDKESGVSRKSNKSVSDSKMSSGLEAETQTVVSKIATVSDEKLRTSETPESDPPKEDDVTDDLQASKEKKTKNSSKTTGIKLAGSGGSVSAESAKVKSLKKKSKPTLKGFVYRMYMELSEIEKVTEEIRSEIQSLGGSKAGDVRLGWRKPKGSYFHFRIMEKHYEQIVSRLGSFGPVRIIKDPHWRVMPEGEIRFILWVEDKDLKAKKQQANGSGTKAGETVQEAQQPKEPKSSESQNE